jgi:hypothetical protein
METRSVALRSVLLAVTATATLSTRSALADEEGANDQTAVRVEVRAGLGAPMGTISAAVVLQPNAVFALGLGAGIATGQYDGPTEQVGAFVRAQLLRHQRLSLGPVVTFSAGERSRGTFHRLPSGYIETLEYRWDPGLRLDAGVGADLAFDQFRVRLEAGLGYYLNDPTCTLHTATTLYSDACGGPDIPDSYVSTPEPGRYAPYVSLAVAYDVRPAATPTTSAAAAPAPQPRVDSAWLAPTALTVPKGSFTLALHEGVLVRGTVGVTDRLQVWGGTSWTVFAGIPLWELGVKLRAVSWGRFHAAIMAEHFGFRFDRWMSLNVTGAGAVGSVCLDQDCASVLSLTALGGRLYTDGDETTPQTDYGFLVSPSAVMTIARYLKVIVETHVPVSNPRDGLWAALLRLPLGALTLDLGLMGSYATAETAETELLPAGSIAYRW